MSIDPIITEVATGVVTTGVTSALALGGRLLKNRVPTRRSSRKLTIDKDTQIKSIISQATSEVARGLSEESKAVEELRKFLVSPEVASVIRQVYAWRLTGGNGEIATMDEIQQRFRLLLKLSGTGPLTEDDSLANTLFVAIVNTCERYLEVAIGKGNPLAKYAHIVGRDRYFSNELGSIKKSLAVLAQCPSAIVPEILRFEQRYRTEVGRRHGFIIPPHLTDVQRVPLDRLYVLPRFAEKSSDEQNRYVDIRALIERLHRTVLLGNPGGGKSTFANKLCHLLASEYDSAPFNGQSVTPIIVVLREYAAENEDHRLSIAEYISQTASVVTLK